MSVLDLYNELSRSLRGMEGQTMAELNARLRALFAEFRVEAVGQGVVGVLPVLRSDVVERFGSEEMNVIIGGEVVGLETAAATHPIALFATSEDALVGPAVRSIAEEFESWRANQ